MKADISEINPSTSSPSITPPVIFAKPSGNEFNSGARNNYQTFNSYKVSYSVGFTPGSLKKTTAGGYQVFMNVHGQMLSEE